MKCTFKKEHNFIVRSAFGANEDNELYKKVMVFMITGLKNIVPLVIKPFPKVTVNGFLKCIWNVFFKL